MKSLTVYLVALLLPICCLQGIAFSLDASDYVPYPTSGPAVSAGIDHTLGLKADGTVLAVGDNSYGQTNVGGWENIVQVSAKLFHTLGLKADGTVLAVGDNSYGQTNVGGWENIVQVSAGVDHTLGLKADGTVLAVGDNSYGQTNVGGWENIVQVSAGSLYTVGLKADGSVLAVGYNSYGQTNVGGWENIVQVSAGMSHTVGLSYNGRVLAVGYNDNGQCNVGGWENIVQVSAGSIHTAGLKEDGTVLVVGWDGDGDYNIDLDWENIVQVGAGWHHTLGLKADGSVVANCSSVYSLCDVGDWFLGMGEPSTSTTTSRPSTTTTSINPTTTTSIDSGCPDGSPIDCGNDWCCPLVLPVCGRGIYIGTCFEAGTNPNCPALTLYGEGSEEVEALRSIRDSILSKTHEGRELIKLYYQWSPVIVRAMEADEDFKEDVKAMVDEILGMVE